MKKRKNPAYAHRRGINELAYRLHEGQQQPDEITPLIGKIVRGVWLIPDGVFISFECGDILEIKPVVLMRTGSYGYGFQVRVGESKEPGFDWGTVLDDKCERPPHLLLLTGLPFHGIDKDVIVFAENYGIRITPEGATFCKTPHSPDHPPTPDAAPKA